MLKYLPYVLLFAVATAIIYGWGFGVLCGRVRIFLICYVPKEFPRFEKL